MIRPFTCPISQDALDSARQFRSEDSDYGESEGAFNEMNALAEQMDEYHFSCRVFPGQDPNQVSFIKIIF